MGSNIIDFFDPKWLPKRQPQQMMVVTPDHREHSRFIRQLYQEHTQPAWVPVDWGNTGTGPTNVISNPFSTANLLDVHRQTFVSSYTMPEWILDETDKRRKNKIARKNRDGAKASQNATGRKWWEHR